MWLLENLAYISIWLCCYKQKVLFSTLFFWQIQEEDNSKQLLEIALEYSEPKSTSVSSKKGRKTNLASKIYILKIALWAYISSQIYKINCRGSSFFHVLRVFSLLSLFILCVLPVITLSKYWGPGIEQVEIFKIHKCLTYLVLSLSESLGDWLSV